MQARCVPGPLQQNHSSVQCLDTFLGVLIYFIYNLARDDELLQKKKSDAPFVRCWPIIPHKIMS